MVLLIRGNVVQSLTQYNAVPDGNVASPGLSFAHAPTTGLSRSTEGNVVVSVGGTAAMEVSTAGITANAFVGNGAGISNIVAANIDGLSQALDVINATSVTANSVTTSNLSAVSNEITVTGHLRPDTNVVYDLGSAERKWRDLYLSSGTLFLGNASVTESDGILQLPSVSIQEASITGNISAAKFVGDGSELTGIVLPPSITSVTITDDSWNPIDDLALSTTSTGYFTIQGNNFEPIGTTVSVGGTAAASVTVVNSQVLRISVNPLATGSYDVVLETGSGSTTKINAVSFDPFPVWSTGSSLGNVYYSTAFNITLAASDGGSAITYSNTSALPPSTTLASNGVLQGNITGNTSATYNFTVEAIDAQLQSALRTFTLSGILKYLYKISAYNSTGGRVMIEGSTYPGSGSTWTNVYGTNVTLAGGISYTDGSPSYLTFNGSRYGTVPLSNPSGAYVHSVAVWFRPTDLSSSQRIFAFGKQNTNKQSRVDITPTVFRSSFYSSNVDWGHSMQVNQWYFIVFTYDGGSVANSRNMYLDGTPLSVTSTSTPGALNVDASETLYIATYISTDLSLIGDLAQFGFWNRVLGASEVTDIWNATRAVFGR